MAYQDHLTRQIEQFGMVLRRLLSGLTGSPGTQEAASATQVEQALDEALDLPHGTLVTLSPEALIALLRTRPECSGSNMDLLERISKKPFGLRSGLSRPCVVVEDLTEHPTMLGFDA